MIKVIEHGNTHQRKRCEDCGCVFEFGIFDTKCYPGTGDVRVVNCPECGEVIAVEAKGEK